jgi:hypothetical protein
MAHPVFLPTDVQVADDLIGFLETRQEILAAVQSLL